MPSPTDWDRFDPMIEKLLCDGYNGKQMYDELKAMDNGLNIKIRAFYTHLEIYFPGRCKLPGTNKFRRDPSVSSPAGSSTSKLPRPDSHYPRSAFSTTSTEHSFSLEDPDRPSVVTDEVASHEANLNFLGSGFAASASNLDIPGSVPRPTSIDQDVGVESQKAERTRSYASEPLFSRSFERSPLMTDGYQQQMVSPFSSSTPRTFDQTLDRSGFRPYLEPGSTSSSMYESLHRGRNRKEKDCVTFSRPVPYPDTRHDRSRLLNADQGSRSASFTSAPSLTTDESDPTSSAYSTQSSNREEYHRQTISAMMETRDERAQEIGNRFLIPLSATHEDVYHCASFTYYDLSNHHTCSVCGISAVHMECSSPSQFHGTNLGHFIERMVNNPQLGRIDRLKNTTMHYFAASGDADFDSIMALGNLYTLPSGTKTIFACRNSLGETPFHILDLTSFGSGDLRKFLREVTNLEGRRFLCEERDIRGRSVLHALLDKALRIDQFREIIEAFNLENSTSHSFTHQSLMTSRDWKGRTTADRVEQHLEGDPGFENVVKKSFVALWRNIRGKQTVIPLRFTVSSQTLPPPGDYDILSEDATGQNILHLVPTYRLEPRDQKKFLKRALCMPVWYDDKLRACVGLDVNNPDLNGTTPLIHTIRAVGRRRNRRKMSKEYREIAQTLESLQFRSDDTIDFLICRLELEYRYANVLAYINNTIQRLGVKRSNTVGHFFAVARQHHDSQITEERKYVVKLLTKVKVPVRYLRNTRSAEDVSHGVRQGARFRRLSDQLPNDGREIIELFQRCGADVNIRDNAGLSALHEAVRYGLPDYVQALLEFDANPNARTDAGTGVIAYAQQCLGVERDIDTYWAVEFCLQLILSAGGKEQPSVEDEFYMDAGDFETNFTLHGSDET